MVIIDSLFIVEPTCEGVIVDIPRELANTSAKSFSFAGFWKKNDTQSTSQITAKESTTNSSPQIQKQSYEDKLNEKMGNTVASLAHNEKVQDWYNKIMHIQLK